MKDWMLKEVIGVEKFLTSISMKGGFWKRISDSVLRRFYWPKEIKFQ